MLGVPASELERLELLLRLQARLPSVIIERVLWAPPSPQMQICLGRLRRGGAQVLVASAPWSDPAQLRRFQRDQLLLRSLDHPCVAALREAGEADGLCWAAFAAPAGTPLRLGSRRSEVEALALIRHYSRGLQALVAAGMTQRYAQPAQLHVESSEPGEVEAQVVDLGSPARPLRPPAPARHG